MPTASIIIDQPLNTEIPGGVAGRWRDDLAIGQLVQLRNWTNAEVDDFRWELVVPEGSIALGSDPSAAEFTFTPDIAGSYLVRLVINGGGINGDSTSTIVSTYDPGGYRIPALEETTEANYRDGAPSHAGWDPALYRWLTAINTGGRIVREIDFRSPGVINLATGVNPQVVVGGVTWTSNAGDADQPQAGVESFDLGPTGLVAREVDGGVFTEDDQTAALIWTTWPDLAGPAWDPTRRWMIQARLSERAGQGNGDSVGIGIFRPAGIGTQPNVDPTVEGKVMFQSYGHFGAQFQARAGESSRFRTRLASTHDVISLDIAGPHSFAGFTSTYDSTYSAWPMDDALVTGGWSLGSDENDRAYLDAEADRVALFFTGELSSTSALGIEQIRVLCW